MQYNKTCDNYLQWKKPRTPSNTPRIAMRTTRALLKEANDQTQWRSRHSSRSPQLSGITPTSVTPLISHLTRANYHWTCTRDRLAAALHSTSFLRENWQLNARQRVICLLAARLCWRHSRWRVTPRTFRAGAA